MTEIKADYSTNYWETVARQERKKADDNMRLAAERGSEIDELRQKLKAEKIRSARLMMALIELVHRVNTWGTKNAGQSLPTELSDAVFQADLVLTDTNRGGEE